MAITFPENLAGYTKSEAEVDLFNALKKQLSEGYTVFHSVAWLLPAYNNKPPHDGESDFVILHPEKGLLTIEVKGGLINYNPVSSSPWSTTPRNSTSRKPIKDPFMQAKDNKHSLRRKVLSLPEWNNRLFRDGHAVAFPDGSIPSFPARPDVDPAIVIGKLDLETIELKIEQIYDFWQGNNKSFTGFDKKAVRLITDMLGIRWEMHIPKLGEKLVKELDHMIRLTDEQFELLNALNHHRRAAIAGPAGSGKTVMAIRKARRLAEEGMQTLLVCFNTSLCAHLRYLIPAHQNLLIYSFHELCGKMAPGVSQNNISQDEFYKKVLPEALLHIAGDLSEEKRFDAILVDEGQDFEPDWLLALRFLLRERNKSIFYVFFDDNQNIYNCDVSGLDVGEPFLLTRNCRNTRQVFKTLLNYYHGQTEIRSQGPEGDPVVIHDYKNVNDLRAQLVSKIAELVYREQVAEQDMVILTRSINTLPMNEITRLGGFEIVNSVPEGDQIRVSTIQSYKGLECKVVILVIDERLDEITEMMYVAISRANNRLFIYKPKNITLGL